MKPLPKILLYGFLAFMVLAMVQEREVFLSAWMGSETSEEQTSEAERQAAVDTVRLMLELMRHLYVNGGDPRFTERMPASPGVLDEMLSDIHYLAKNHRRQETVLKKLEIISIEEAGGGRLDIRTRELWQINILWLTGDEHAEPPRIQLTHGRYLVSSGNQGWRVDAWELAGPGTDRS
jgi:hypothetical protein